MANVDILYVWFHADYVLYISWLAKRGTFQPSFSISSRNKGVISCVTISENVLILAHPVCWTYGCSHILNRPNTYMYRTHAVQMKNGICIYNVIALDIWNVLVKDIYRYGSFEGIYNHATCILCFNEVAFDIIDDRDGWLPPAGYLWVYGTSMANIMWWKWLCFMEIKWGAESTCGR